MGSPRSQPCVFEERAKGLERYRFGSQAKGEKDLGEETGETLVSMGLMRKIG